MFQREAWKFSKMMIFNKNRKFLNEFWKIIFHHLKINLLYTTTYYSSANETSERTNQTMKIIMCFAMMKKDVIDFARLLSSLQFTMNNLKNASIKLSFNEIFYEFKSIEFIDLLTQNDVNQRANDKNSSIHIEKKKSCSKKNWKCHFNDTNFTKNKIRF